MQRQRLSERESASTIEKGHGRIERRTLSSTTALNDYLNWPGVQQVCHVQRERTIRGQRSTEVVYFITSLSRQQADAKTLLQLIRGHWGAIENGLHYVRDEALGEDRSTIFRGHAPQNLAALRNVSLNWLRQAGISKITATLRSFARNPFRLFTKLGYPN